MFLTGRLALVLALASAAALFIPGRPGIVLVVVDALVLAAAATDILRAPDPRRVPRRRDHPDVASVGAAVDVALSVVNPVSRPVRGTVRDATVPSLRPDPAFLVARLAPGSSRLAYRIRPERRGRFVLGPVTVRCAGPLGLAGRQRTVPLATELKVYPALEGRRQIEGLLRRGRVLETGTRSARVRGGGLEFDALREYHPDDEFRRINWTATARAGKPIANEYREERNQQVLLLLDAGRTMAATVAAAPRFEYAIDAAVALATLAMDVGDRVGAFAFDEQVRASVPPRSDRAQPHRIIDALFDIEPSLAASDYVGAVGRILGRFRRRALVALFTDLADEAALDPLLTAVPTMARRHLVLVVEVADPAVERLSRIMPGSAPEAFTKAAAAAARTRRESAASRLSRLGATVVDRPPRALAGALADAYLRAKAFGRL